MSITERDRRILFLEARREENDAGEQEVTGWEELFYRWAAYEPVSDGERLRAQGPPVDSVWTSFEPPLEPYN